MYSWNSKCLLVIGSLLSGGASSGVVAEMHWSSFSLSYLKGEQYQVGDSHRQFLTVEHASGHNWGDNFFFLDHSRFRDDTVTNYFELSPRLSLSYLTGLKWQAGWLQDVLVASTWEGGDGFDNFLIGVGVSLAIPGFKYVGVNVYRVNNDQWEDDEQVTLTWGVPFTVAGQPFLYDGFLDYSTESATNEKEMNCTSQLKWNVAELFGSTAPFYVGVEYVYWKSKYGIPDVDERNPNLLVKWHW